MRVTRKPAHCGLLAGRGSGPRGAAACCPQRAASVRVLGVPWPPWPHTHGALFSGAVLGVVLLEPPAVPGSAHT